MAKCIPLNCVLAISCQYKRGLVTAEKSGNKVREIGTQQLFTLSWIIYHFECLVPEQICSDKILLNTDRNGIKGFNPLPVYRLVCVHQPFSAAFYSFQDLDGYRTHSV